MRNAAWILPLLLSACRYTEDLPEEPAEPAAEEESPYPGPPPTPIKDYTDLEKYSGQTIYVLGTFDVHPLYRGKHGLVRLDSGLVVYLPHIDEWYKGEEWFRFIGQRVYVGGKLYSYINPPIDGMRGPYLDRPTLLSSAEVFQKKPETAPRKR